MFEKTLAKHLGHPSGLIGRLVARGMNSTNERMNAFSVQNLEVRADDRVLDAGFGGGDTLAMMARSAPQGGVTGLEVSDAMLSRARKRHRALVRGGRLELVKGSIEQMPFADARFDRACTVNTVYFWSSPRRAARELWRVLRPDGVLVLAFRPAEGMRELRFVSHGFTLYDPDVISHLLKGAGFGRVRFVHGDDGFLGFICAIARKPV